MGAERLGVRATAIAVGLAIIGVTGAAAPVAADETVRVQDIFAGAGGSRPGELTVAGPNVYFAATSKRYGRELWKTRGSAASTKLVQDIRVGKGSSRPQELVAAGPMLFFLANDGQVWRTKGTAASTKRLRAPRWQDKQSTASMGGKLYWAAPDGLWVSGGEPWNTRRLHPVEADRESGMHRVGGRIYFAGRTPATGSELWMTDGTRAGTRMVAELVPGPGSAFNGCSEWAHVGPTLVFTASDRDGHCGWQLWASDGTAPGTRKLRDFSEAAVPTQLTTMGSAVYFAAFRESDGTELWRTDGTAEGTTIVMDINPGAIDSEARRSDPRHLTATRQGLLFEADDGPHGRELWRSDGSPAGTTLVKDIAKGRKDAHIGLITEASGGWTFFGAARVGEGHEPFKSKGTANGTKRTKDVRDGQRGGLRVDCDDCAVAFGKHVFFRGNDGVSGWELWRWTR